MISVSAGGMSAVDTWSGDGADGRVYADRRRRAYRGVGGAGKANGRAATAADRVQSFRRGFHGLKNRTCFSPRSFVPVPCPA